ncbi:MAG TPA: hypothetical protein VHO24_07860 [Opitutaceae bacterium]|nr:hypothetical protein [Opitutaceae bacterium]
MKPVKNYPVKQVKTPIFSALNKGGFVQKIASGGRMVAMGLTVLLALSTAQKASANFRADTLQAINWVENPSNSPRPGKCGELGAYQFRAATWQMHTQRPFAEAIDRSCSDEVAVLHYEWLKTALAKAGVEPTPYNIALAWNAGVGAVIRGRAPAVSHDYAQRVTNLVTDLRSRAVAMK